MVFADTEIALSTIGVVANGCSSQEICGSDTVSNPSLIARVPFHEKTRGETVT